MHRIAVPVRLASNPSRALSLSAGLQREWDLNDPEQMRLYKLYRPERVTPCVRGVDLLKDPGLNKGMAFTLEERQYLGVHGLLPPAFMTSEQQAYRVITKLRKQPDDLARYIQLDGLQKFGLIYRNPKGIYVTINDNSISKICQILSNWKSPEVKAIVVTDGERILGLGDLGCYGIGIPVGKMALYVALAGIQPRWCLPVQIDVGTDNQTLLNDPFYIGLRRNRVRGEEYDRLINNFMKACRKKYGQDVLIQFEDFGNKNAFRLLEQYQGKYCMFNDDIQGTASVVVAGLLACTRVTQRRMSDTKYVFFGAGGAALGVAEMCVRQMESEGLSYEKACDQIYMMDVGGLITKQRKNIENRHVPFAKDLPDTHNLLEVVQSVRPGALIGASTVRGAFTDDVIRTMAEFNARPIIFALSNPTSKAECLAEDAYRVTHGTVLFASGSPFKNVELHGRVYKPGQGNNAYIFPGIALGVILFKVSTIDNKLFLMAARMVAESVTEKSLAEGRVFPRLKEIREISIKIAMKIAEESYRDGTAKLYPEPTDKEMFIRSQIYSVEYGELINRTYNWPSHDMKHGFPVPVVRRDSMDD
uniref:Malic enzyme n=1 Tax=Globodera pallida TaxID=36090 RepID=A0A183C2X5_GLOPA